MPYISEAQREKYEPEIQSIVTSLNLSGTDTDTAKGELNYVIFSVICRLLKARGLRYAIAQDFIGGVLTCCQMELYRRLMVPYEDLKLAQNGDAA